MSENPAIRSRSIRDWLVGRVADETGLPEHEIPDDEPIRSLGVDSRGAVAIAAELTDITGIALEPTVVYSYPTIAELAAFVASGDDPGAHAYRTDDDDHLPRTDDEPVAIIGIACRMPGGYDQRGFWTLLMNAHDAVTSVPEDRLRLWYPNESKPINDVWGGFVDDVDAFDSRFFKIPPHEAALLDPQHRLLLEVSWEAIEDAGTIADDLRGSDAGVFIGISSNDYGRHVLPGDTAIGGAAATGNALSMAANRLSYFYDLHRPSIAIDTACSSSLVATHLACRSLTTRDCNLAIAGGVNLLLDPYVTESLRAGGFLARDGRCKVFDARADGYVRSEGCGVVVLKRLSDAIADGDRIYATIRGGAVDQDGRTNGLTAPNPRAQEAVLRAAYHDAQIDPGLVHYVECHGSGTALGDPIEARALASVVGTRDADAPSCLIGSVKSNIGHLESAAGIAGLIKLALCLFHGRLMPSIHFDTPNPNIPFDDLRLQAITSAREWPRGDEARYAGISSFGFGGTNAHLVLQDAPAPAQKPTRSRAPTILPVSARTNKSCIEAIDRWITFLGQVDEASLHDVVTTAARRRTHHPYRVAAIGETSKELAESLERLRDEARQQDERVSGDPQIAFAFSGQGIRPHEFISAIEHPDRLYRSVLRRCDEIIKSHAGWSIWDAIKEEDDRSLLERPRYAQPILVSIQIAMAELWQSFGISPDAVVGHSIGELAAAHIAGVLELEEAILLAVRRGNLMEPLVGRGGMLAAGLNEEEALQVATRFGDRVSLAAVNAPGTVALSGHQSALEEIERELASSGRFVQWLPINVPGHSVQMDIVADQLTQHDDLHPRPSRIPFYSTVFGRRCDGDDLTASYWARNLRETVRFKEAIEALVADGVDVILEIAPRRTLTTPLKQTLRAAHNRRRMHVVSSDIGDGNGRHLGVLANLYMVGCNISWRRLYRERFDVVSLPAYPWEKQTHWFRARKGDVGRPTRSGSHPLLGDKLDLSVEGIPSIFEQHVDARLHPYLANSGADAKSCAVGALIEIAVAALRRVSNSESIVLQDVRFHEPLLVDESGRTVQTIVTRTAQGEFTFSIGSRGDNGTAKKWRIHVEGAALAPPDGDDEVEADKINEIAKLCTSRIEGNDADAAFADGEVGSAALLEGLEAISVGKGVATAGISLGGEANSLYGCDPELIGAALRLVRPALPTEALSARTAIVATYARRIVYSGEFATRSATAAVSVARTDSLNHVDLTVAADDGASGLLQIDGLQLQTSTALPDDSDSKPHFYDVVWRPQAGSAEALQKIGRWIIFADEAGVGDQLADRVRKNEGEAVVVKRSNRFEYPGDGNAFLSPSVPEHYVRLFDELQRTDRPQQIEGVVHLWSLDANPRPSETRIFNENIDITSGSVLEILKSLATAVDYANSKILLVTRGAQHVLGGDVSNIFGASIWGLAKAIPFEIPTWRWRCVDLDPREGPGTASAWLLTQLGDDSSEAEVAVRTGERYVRRLLAAERDSGIENHNKADSLAVKADATYLITGGTGGLGRSVAAWLVGRGATSVALLARHENDDTNRLIKSLGDRGADIRFYRADTRDSKELESVLQAIRATSPPIRGIIHAAGVLEDGPLRAMSRESLIRVLEPKAKGAWNLHTLTLNEPLDWFIVFSSAASVLGSPGQANYCAANALIDALSHQRVDGGKPSCAINWGPWAVVGMAARASESGRDLSVRTAARAFTPDEGLRVFGDLVGRLPAQVLALPYDLRDLFQFYPAARGESFFEDVVGEIRQLRSGLVAARGRRNASREYVAPRNAIEEKIATIWQAALGIDQIGMHDDFFELGGDSVFANTILSEIERTLGVTLDAEAAFEEFTVAGLAALADAWMVKHLDSISDADARRLLTDV